MLECLSSVVSSFKSSELWVFLSRPVSHAANDLRPLQPCIQLPGENRLCESGESGTKGDQYNPKREGLWVSPLPVVQKPATLCDNLYQILLGWDRWDNSREATNSPASWLPAHQTMGRLVWYDSHVQRDNGA